MESNSTLISEIKQILHSGNVPPHRASSTAYLLFLLMEINAYGDQQAIQSMMADFNNMLVDNGLNDLASRQINYALKLANSKQDLEYEEMHKLFSLCDEIYALEKLNISAPSQLLEEFKTSIRERFSHEKKKAKLVAEDKFESWKKSLWWYTECLGNNLKQ